VKNKCCRKCRFWEEHNIYAKEEFDEEYDNPNQRFRRGHCYRNAPSPAPTKAIDSDETWERYYNAMIDTMWPQTRDYWWCGEYKKRTP
jgi:hypothetical protein